MIQTTPEKLCIQRSDLHFKNQIEVYRGKVRDVYFLSDKIVLVATDRISAFDHILPRPIPFKGQVLNQIAAHFLDSVRDICPVWIESSPDPNVSIGKKCDAIPLEMVVRGYMAGHLWRTYQKGARMLCGVSLRDGYVEGEKLDTPIITPTTKASEGHDEDISIDEIIKRDIVSSAIWDQLKIYSLELFDRGSAMADAQGLILVDTKYEFGLYDGQLTLMDEIHTPDSSRYYIKEGYTDRQSRQEKQIQLSKEFVREWLISKGFQGHEDQLMPEMPDALVWQISERYIDLYERIIGSSFNREAHLNINERIQFNLQDYLI